MTTTQVVAAAVEGVARAMHDLALALAATDPPARTDQPEVPAPPTGNGRRCDDCGGAVAYREWTSRAGKACRAYKCENSRAGEDHFIEWAAS